MDCFLKAGIPILDTRPVKSPYITHLTSPLVISIPSIRICPDLGFNKPFKCCIKLICGSVWPITPTNSPFLFQITSSRDTDSCIPSLYIYLNSLLESACDIIHHFSILMISFEYQCPASKPVCYSTVNGVNQGLDFLCISKYQIVPSNTMPFVHNYYQFCSCSFFHEMGY